MAGQPFSTFAAISAILALSLCVVPADGGCVQPREMEECPMMDYLVYPTLDVDEAVGRVREVAGEHVAAWKAKTEKTKGKKKGKGAKLDFCEDLIRATICNLLIPPCEGDGTKRYRKPCKAFEEVIKHGCGWELNMGDLSFAEPPDCYELPIRMGEEEAYADAAAIGADSTEADTEGRANDLTEIANVLSSAGQQEYAVHILLSVLKYRPDDGHAHLEIFSTVHAAFEQGKSLGLQLNMTRSAEDWSACGAKHKVDKNYKKHKGIKETEKIEYIAALAEKHSSRYFVETGTWYGETINAVKGQFEKLVSIEISAQLSEYASRRFSNDPHIQILNGDSLAVLPDVLKQRDRSVATLFWLDGHFSGSRFETAKAELDTPILIELDAVMRDATEQDVIMIDDARLFRGYGDCGGDYRSECYPSVDDLRRVVCRHRPDWMFEVEDDLMRIYSLGTSTGTQQREAKQTPPIMRSNEATPTVGANKASPTMGTKKTLPTVGGGKKGGSGKAPGWGVPSAGKSTPPNTRAPPFNEAVPDDSGAFHIKL